VIDRKRYNFEDNDPIFFRDKAAPALSLDQQGFNKCQCCDSPFKNVKLVHYCQFCGHPYCKLCLVKTMPFPQNNSDLKNRGDICKVCDRKFYIRLMVQGSKTKIESQSMTIDSLQDQLVEKEKQCKNLDIEFKDFEDRSTLDSENLT